MNIFSRGKATHSQRLEKWIGPEALAGLSRATKDFYYPIPVHQVPGRVFAMPGGDFAGEIEGGQEANVKDLVWDRWRRYRRACRLKGNPHGQLNAFASVNAVVAAFTGGKGQTLPFQKVGTAPTAVAGAIDLWGVGNMPAAGAIGGAGPTGTAHSRTDTGALAQQNPGSANTLHFLNAAAQANFANTLLLYDRLASQAKTMNAITMDQIGATPTRYQNTSATAVDYTGGSFAYPRTATLIAATAHNWVAGDTASPNQGCTYVNQAGVAKAMPQVAGISACAANQIDLLLGTWFWPLAAGDVGVQKMVTVQHSALVATGTQDIVVGHPIALIPIPVINMSFIWDGLYTALNLASILDGACLSFLELTKPATSATTYNGIISMVAE